MGFIQVMQAKVYVPVFYVLLCAIVVLFVAINYFYKKSA